MIYPPTTIHELAARINQFIQNYGGKPVKSNSPRGLDVISDFLCVIGAELKFTVKQRPIEPNSIPTDAAGTEKEPVTK